MTALLIVAGTRSFHTYIPLDGSTIRLKLFSSSATYIDHKIMRTTEASVTNYNVGEYVLIRINDSVQLGLIMDKNEDNSFQVKYMKRTRDKNSFSWASDYTAQAEDTVVEQEILRKGTSTP